VRAQAPDLAPKFLPVLNGILSRLDSSLTAAEWFEPGALTVSPPDPVTRR
jgi:hypothetical protein